ncbi:leukocyte elastase inhibitor-like [Penaeus japonicus]|uniref:leukocyte elastase inhibitor-like n=1 Tax=Penaeus japonicus TaxID=27405 RepID=UPI001C70FD14|nr:leukocyte elastase inhibitor-like [Penaeus japonicus]
MSRDCPLNQQLMIHQSAEGDVKRLSTESAVIDPPGATTIENRRRSPAPRPVTPRPHRALDPTSSSGGHRFSRAHFEFTLDLYGALVRESADLRANVLFSPVSVAALLYPLLLSDDTELSEQVRKILRYSNMTISEISKGHTAMMDNFEETYYHDKLHLAHSLFVQAGSPSAAFVREQYKGAAQEVDFRGNATGVLKGVNRWVLSQTDGRVAGTVTEAVAGEVAEQREAVEGLAVVAVYYSGQWLHQFQPNLTFDKGLFYPSSESRFEVPMMVGKLELPLGYSPEMEVRILELPYASRRVSMFVLLPDDPDFGLARLEANLPPTPSKALFSTLQGGYCDERVNLRLPRFRLGVSPPVQSALISLGLRQVFPGAAPSEAASGPRLLLHDTLHKAVLEVREAGEEATTPSSNGGEQVGTFGDKYFEVDHPFLILVWDYIASSVVYMGRIVTPEPLGVGDAS